MRVWNFVRHALRDDFTGAFGDELKEAQRRVILDRTVVLVWISVFVMPSTIWAYVFFAKPEKLLDAVFIVLGAIAAVFLIRAAVLRGWFNRHYHLAMVLLVGGVFGPTGTAIVELTHGSGGDFFFAFFLIFFAFTSLFPASARWIVITSLCVVASWFIGRVLRPGGLEADQRFYENMLYFFQLTFIGTVLNRVIVPLFFGERRANLELRLTRDALASEMKVAQQMQQLLLPKLPRVPGHDVHGIMLPAEDVGGDYYDVIETKGGRCFVAIGDVSGHGVTAGVTMMMARSTLIATIEADPHVALPTLYAAVNHALHESLRRMDLRMYMTFMLFEHLGNGRFRAVGAHPPPIILRSRTGTLEEIALDGAWLGLVDKMGPEDCPEVEVRLMPDDMLLLYTDGIVERRLSQDGEMFGYQRLGAALVEYAGKGDAKATVEGIIAEMHRFSGTQDDDVTLLALRFRG